MHYYFLGTGLKKVLILVQEESLFIKLESLFKTKVMEVFFLSLKEGKEWRRNCLFKACRTPFPFQNPDVFIKYVKVRRKVFCHLCWRYSTKLLVFKINHFTTIICNDLSVRFNVRSRKLVKTQVLLLFLLCLNKLKKNTKISEKSKYEEDIAIPNTSTFLINY